MPYRKLLAAIFETSIMDKERQIRFLYPPLIFLGSLALGTWLDYPNDFGEKVSSFLSNANITSVIIAILGAGSTVLVLGFIIGTLTILLLRILFFRNGFSYEFILTKGTYDKIGRIILENKDDSVRKEDRVYAAVVFDHAYIDQNVHGWIARRWNAFLIAAFSAFGLLASLLIGWLLGISLTISWVIVTILLTICFILQSRLSYIETMKMIAFLTRVKKFEKNEYSY